MTDSKTNSHRPLVSGVHIKCGIQHANGVMEKSEGTLAGVARRNSDNRKMLVTCQHVLAGMTSINNKPAYKEKPSGTRRMYQPLVDATDTDDLVGYVSTYAPIDRDGTNFVDVAMCQLYEPSDDEDGTNRVTAEFKLHDPSGHTTHSDRKIISGTIEPTKDMKLILVGAEAGEIEVKVKEVDRTVTANGTSFAKVIELRTVEDDEYVTKGDSGAGCFLETSQGSGLFQLACIMFGGEYGTLTEPDRSRTAYAFSALEAENALDIRFGDPELGGIEMGKSWIIDEYFQAGEALHCGDVAVMRGRAGHPRVYKASAVNKGRIIGIVHTPPSKSVGDEIARAGATRAADQFVPIVVKGVAKTLSAGMIGLGDPVVASATRSRPAGTGKGGVATVEAVNNAPTANAVATPSKVVQNAAVTLNGSGSSDPDTGDTLSYEWKQTEGATVELSGATAASATFSAPAAPDKLKFTLTVTDKHGAQDTDTVTVTVAKPPASKQ